MFTTAMNSNERSIILLLTFTVEILGLTAPITAQAQERTVTLELALKPASQTLRVGQALEYTVHLANPNEEMVTLPHIPPLASLGVELRSDQGYLALQRYVS